MGLTSWRGEIVTSSDAKVAKNYLQELEIKRLELLVDQFLSLAELCSIEKKPMYMADWITKLDDFLVLNEKEILRHSGKVSRKDMEAKVRQELLKYRENEERKKLQAIEVGPLAGRLPAEASTPEVNPSSGRLGS